MYGAAPSTKDSRSTRSITPSASVMPRGDWLITVTMGMFSTKVNCTWSWKPFITASVVSSTITPRVIPSTAMMVMTLM